MSEQADQARRFMELHHGERPLLLPNPWDRGSAKLLASLGVRRAGDDEQRLGGDARASSTAR